MRVWGYRDLINMQINLKLVVVAVVVVVVAVVVVVVVVACVQQTVCLCSSICSIKMVSFPASSITHNNPLF